MIFSVYIIQKLSIMTSAVPEDYNMAFMVGVGEGGEVDWRSPGDT